MVPFNYCFLFACQLQKTYYHCFSNQQKEQKFCKLLSKHSYFKPNTSLQHVSNCIMRCCMQIVFNVGIPIICFALCNFGEMMSFVAMLHVACQTSYVKNKCTHTDLPAPILSSYCKNKQKLSDDNFLQHGEVRNKTTFSRIISGLIAFDSRSRCLFTCLLNLGGCKCLGYP